jgi:predicted nucleic acid-binding protein
MSRSPRVSLALLALSLVVSLSFAQPRVILPPAVEEEPPFTLPTGDRYSSHLDAARKHIQDKDWAVATTLIQKLLDLNEDSFVTVTRKLQVDARIARRKVELLAEFDVATPDVPDILAAIDLTRLHNLSFWDALVLRAAQQAGCGVLFTEDMQHAREMDGLRIVNPFR